MKNEFSIFNKDIFDWTQPDGRERKYFLRKGDDTLGKLFFRTSEGTYATVENKYQDWTIKRIGFLKPLLSVRMPESGSDYALYQPVASTGGKLHLLDGRKVNWSQLDINDHIWQFLDGHQTSIMAFSSSLKQESNRMIPRLKCKVVMETNRVTNLEWSLLINLGLYLLTFNQIDSEFLEILHETQ